MKNCVEKVYGESLYSEIRNQKEAHRLKITAEWRWVAATHHGRLEDDNKISVVTVSLKWIMNYCYYWNWKHFWKNFLLMKVKRETAFLWITSFSFLKVNQAWCGRTDEKIWHVIYVRWYLVLFQILISFKELITRISPSHRSFWAQIFSWVSLYSLDCACLV